MFVVVLLEGEQCDIRLRFSNYLGSSLFWSGGLMIIPVHMFAFAKEGDRSKVRPVDVPTGEAESARMVEDLLELVFVYGQNEKQQLTLYRG